MLFVCVEIYDPVNPVGSCSPRSVYLTTLFPGQAWDTHPNEPSRPQSHAGESLTREIKTVETFFIV